jgi:hypothetical protein
MIALELDRGVRVGLATAGLLAPVALGLLLRIASGSALVEEVIAELRPTQSCDSRRLDARCDEGVCVASVCRVIHEPVRRREQESCRGGELCAPGLECEMGLCTREPRVADASCRAPEVQGALMRLRRRCAGVKGRDEVGLSACSEVEWEKMARADKGVDADLLALPGAFAVFFPVGAPDAAGRWVSPHMREHYVASLRGSPAIRGALGAAKAVMVVGRASVTGDALANRELAQRRATTAAEWIKEAARVQAPVLVWGLADELTLSIGVMRGLLAAPIAEDEEAARELMELGRGMVGETAALNQVALVVPLRCDGQEFFPRPTVYAAPAREAER